ncbi:EthD family reductase [Paracraurococcus ruber]|uniref:Ethyl tert-butyl ether degradation protein EthD n=1 Tax=Paracraurococcus ruber TaxID=77675 RepID=A0ABS1CYU4_9PROT|nr:EthD family reductase [Paracraurococcus ruber]MBK1659376.1 ethyl tert-butyl ether degradation protein EthD [Paracraurococcus ruber]TDG28070.1 EthD family reductase [Paracraurococcus ruber]
MIMVSVLYPQDGGTKFDEAYYMQKHIPLVKERWSGMGLQDLKVLKGVPGPDGSAAPYRIMAMLTWESAEAFGKGAKAHGPELFGDVPNFTDIKPAVQISELLG